MYEKIHVTFSHADFRHRLKRYSSIVLQDRRRKNTLIKLCLFFQISAQESRRKKKEYMDQLERKVEILVSENTDYRKRVDTLEQKNASLLSQLAALQALVARGRKWRRGRRRVTSPPRDVTVPRRSAGRPAAPRRTSITDCSDHPAVRFGALL